MTGAVEVFLDTRADLVKNGWRSDADILLASAMETSLIELIEEPPVGTAVVALGGFGRGSMALHSDVDLLFLHRGVDPDELTRRVLRPLWDAHLKVGHLTHTSKGAVALASAQLHTLSTMLTGRFLVGDLALFQDYADRFERLVERDLGRICKTMVGEERHRRDREPYRLMAADLKNDRGGVRSLDLVDWRGRMSAKSRSSDAFDSQERILRAELTRLRSAIHVAAGRLHDRYDFELRASSARWFGGSIEELGRTVLTLRRQIEELVDRVWEEVADRRPPAVTFIEGLRPERRAKKSIAVVNRWIGEVVEDWSRLRDQPHLVPFHKYPVADHTLASVDEAWSMLDGRPDDPIAVEILHDLDGSDLLIWAMLLHDIGKGGSHLADNADERTGSDGDHARVGAGRVPAVLASTGLDEDDVLTVVRLVECHLLLADLATRHDMGDRATLAWAIDRIGDRRTLQLLYLMTVADSRATGTDTWSAWRAELVRRAYRQVERAMAREAMPEDLRIQAVADEVLVDGPDLNRREVVEHLSGLDGQYRLLHGPETIGDHVRLARSALGPGRGVVMIRPGDPARITVMADDRPRLMLGVTSVLVVHRASIVDARLATRSDGRVFDTFDVIDPGADRLTRIHDDLQRVLRGGFDISDRLDRQRHAYRMDRLEGIVATVVVKRRPDGGGIVEVECADRVGLLHDLAIVFDQMGMPITRARVDTRGRIAFDTFHVARLPSRTDGLVEQLKTMAGRPEGSPP